MFEEEEEEMLLELSEADRGLITNYSHNLFFLYSKRLSYRSKANNTNFTDIFFAPKEHFRRVGRITVVDSSVSCPDEIFYAAWENGWVEYRPAAVPAFREAVRLTVAHRNLWVRCCEFVSTMLGSVLLRDDIHPPDR